MTGKPQGKWRVTGATVRGANHMRSGLPNQDAIGWTIPESSGGPLMIALADGHGAAIHYRSHTGARSAVRTALSSLKKYRAAHRVSPDSMAEMKAIDLLCRNFVDGWRAAVSDDLARRPIAEWEIEALSGRVSAGDMKRLEADPSLAYGSTFMAALLSDDSVLYLQLGDGNIVEVSGDGGRVNAPFAKRDDLVGNETESLCSPDAQDLIRVHKSNIDGSALRGIMLSTDGYVNSFASEGGLAQAAIDLYGISQEEGMLELSKSLPEWLRMTSVQGSGDDITVGLAFRDLS